MINSSLNSSIPCTSKNEDKRLDNIEQVLEENKNNFGTANFTAENADIQNLKTGKHKSTSIETVSIKANYINVDNLDIDGPINMANVTVSGKVTTADLDAADGKIDNLKSTSVTTQNATIDNLIVGQIKSKDNNTMLNDLTVAGTASINKLNLGDPNVDAINVKVFGANTANINNGTIKNLNGVENEVVKDIKLGNQISRGDSIQVNVVKLEGKESMIVGDTDNQVILGCASRPLWNDKAIATLDDLGNKIVPAYKGRLATEAELANVVNPTLGDYYIITLLTKGVSPDVRTGIGYALYNGVAFDTDFFYELDGYRLAADQDLVDNAQDTAIANEIARAKAKENELYEAGTKRLIEKNINTLETPELDEMYGSSYWGRVYTGIASEWKGESTLPIGAESAGFCLEILANKNNTIQRYTINTTSGPKVWLRNYGNKTWSDWKKVAFTDSKVDDSLRLDGKTLTELRQLLFDDAHPIGDTFVSNDGGDDPANVYNRNGITSEWTYIGQSFGIHGWRRTK